MDFFNIQYSCINILQQTDPLIKNYYTLDYAPTYKYYYFKCCCKNSSNVYVPCYFDKVKNTLTPDPS